MINIQDPFFLPCSYTEMRLWHKTSIFFMHIIFFHLSSFFFQILQEGRKHCGIVTYSHIFVPGLHTFFFILFHIINLASLFPIYYFFCLPFSEKREKRIKENIFSVQSFHLFLYVYHIDSLALHTLHMFTLLTFGQPFMKFSVYDFFVDFFLFLNFSFHYRLFF